MRSFFLPIVLLAATASPHGVLAQSPANAATSSVSRTQFGEKLRLEGLPHAGKIDESLYRGAQPHKEGFAQLKKLGITTVVDLRGEDPGKIAWERKQAESLGIRFVSIPVSGWSPPTNEQVAQFLSLFTDEKGKVFVHCHYGDDRTGVFVATYRITRDGWPAEHAIKEMYFFGFNGFWHPAMKSYIRRFPFLLESSPVLAPYRLHPGDPMK